MVIEAAALKLLLAGGSLGMSYWAWITRPTCKFRRTLERVIVANNIFDEERRPDGKRFRSYPKVAYVYENWNGYTASVHLPVNIAPSTFAKYKEVFEMVTKSEVDLEFEGSVCHMSFYQLPLHKRMNFDDKILHEVLKRDLSVVVGFSRRGMEVVDFSGEAGAHLLIAGGTGMGKSILLRLIVTTLLYRYGRNINVVLINNKVTDNWPYMDIPNVEIVESLGGAVMTLEDAIRTIDLRKRQLFEKGYQDANEWNANESEKMTPYFIVIDEAGRFTGDKDFQNNLIEIAERGRFVEMHLIIATQRPDGRDVLHPRIKDNCLTKIALRTGTKGGSETILGDPVAYNLPHVQGRAILFVNRFRTIQVPFMSKEQCLALIGHLKGGKSNVDGQGQRYLGEFTEVRNHEPEPHSQDTLPRRGKTRGNRK